MNDNKTEDLNKAIILLISDSLITVEPIKTKDFPQEIPSSVDYLLMSS